MAIPEKYKNIVHKLARFGCFSIGSVYLLVGIIAILSLLGEAEDAADEERMINVIIDAPGGEVLIWLVIVGLFGYIIWRIFEAIKDPYEFGSDLMGRARRTGVALSAIGYGTIAISAIQVITGNGGNGEEEQQMLVGKILDWPAGPWIIGVGGFITVVTGLIQFKYVVQGDYNKRVDIESLAQSQKKAVHFLAYYGYFARGIILMILGYFLLRAAFENNPGAVGDTDSAFDFIGGGLLGNLMFFIVAAGTASYGIFMYIFCIFYKFEKG